MFSIPKKELRKFLNDFSLTQLIYYIKRKHEKEVKRSFKELPLHGVLIKKPYAMRLNNIDILRQFPFDDELNIVKMSKVFKGYSINVLDSKDPSVHLTISRPSIKDLFENLLNELKALNIK